MELRFSTPMAFEAAPMTDFASCANDGAESRPANTMSAADRFIVVSPFGCDAEYAPGLTGRKGDDRTVTENICRYPSNRLIHVRPDGCSSRRIHAPRRAECESHLSLKGSDVAFQSK